MLFEGHISAADAPRGYIPLQLLTQRFAQHPDPMLAAMGGSRVDLAIGLDREAYQLEITQRPDTGQVSVAWARVQTSMRRVKDDGQQVPIPGEVPVTLEAAVESLCDTFGLPAEHVWAEGVDLLAFWEGAQAHDRLELPLSRDWKRYSLRNRQPAALAA